MLGISTRHGLMFTTWARISGLVDSPKVEMERAQTAGTA